jgi:type IV pilus assembly protein PilO
VTLHNVNIVASNARDASGTLAMDATARTYRYLDPKEVEAQKAKATKDKKGAKR